MDAEPGVIRPRLERKQINVVHDVLDFFLTAQVVVGPGGAIQVATWLARTTTPHASPSSPKAGMHHIGFFLDSWHDVLKAADVVAKNKTRIDVAPTRARHHARGKRSISSSPAATATKPSRAWPTWRSATRR